MRAFLAAPLSWAVVTAPVQAQDTQTLADIRQELTVLLVEMQTLRRELSTTSGPSVSVSGDTLQRVDLLERELQRLTQRTEELEFRIDRIVRDGTNRVGDLEFRLCELEPGCDIATLGQTPPLGGQTSVAAAPAPPVSTPGASGQSEELAVGERADFDRALAALNAGDASAALSQFESFLMTYALSPLAAEAHFYRGAALSELGRPRDAGLAFLESFSGAPDGPLAPDALYRLGLSLAELQQTREACTTLGEVGVRFPGSLLVANAEAERARLGCG
jgi:tol-pal system protein YbgF